MSGAIGQELVDSFDSGEGYDELVSGMFSGMGMATITSAKNRITGQTAREQQQQKAVIDSLNNTVQNYFNETIVNSPKTEKCSPAVKFCYGYG